MLRIRFVLLLFIISSVIFSCEEVDQPESEAIMLTEIELNSVYFNGQSVEVSGEIVNLIGGTAKLFVSQTPFGADDSQAIKEYQLNANDIFSINVNDLTVGVRYYIKAILEWEQQVMESNVIEYRHTELVSWKKMTNVPASDGFHDFTGLSNYPYVYFYQPLNKLQSRFLTYSFFDQSWKSENNTIFGYRVFSRPRHSPFLFYDLNDFHRGGGYVLEEDYGNRSYYFNDLIGVEVRENFPGEPGPRLTIPLSTGGILVLEKENPVNFWQFKIPLWTKKASFPGPLTFDYKASSFEDNLFLITENFEDALPQELFHYSLQNDQWTKMEDFPGEKRMKGVAFALMDRFFYGTGMSLATDEPLRDIWEYKWNEKRWEKIYEYPGKGNASLSVIRMDERIFMGLGFKTKINTNGAVGYNKAFDFWEFLPNE